MRSPGRTSRGGEEQAVYPLATVSELRAPTEQGEEGVGSLVWWSVAYRVKVWEAAALKDLKLCVPVRAQLRRSWGRDLASAICLRFTWPCCWTRVVPWKDGGQPVYPMPVRIEYIQSPGE